MYRPGVETGLRASMRSYNGRLLFGSSIFLSSSLLFLSEPMMAKAILPWFGGSAGVWTASMLFFQAVLLLGYLYSYWITRFLGTRAQTVVHLALLLASILVLPLRPAPRWEFADSAYPAFWVLGLLAGSIGLPFFTLSTTGPLAQAWYARTAAARFPYRLFALSNLASLLALLAYPLGVEAFLPLRTQLLAWSAGYVIFALLAAASALCAAPERAPAAEEKAAGQPLLWLALAACASTLWLAVANHLSQEVAAVPFLWVLPLGLYLLSFILCFDRQGWYRPRIYRWLLPAAWAAMLFRLALHGSIGGFSWELLLFLFALFACCMFCHGELARRKPEPRRGLTFFYLMIAAGGALGGLFVGLAAPRLFHAYLELPAGIVMCVLLALALLYGYVSPRRLTRLAAVALVAFVAAAHWSGRSGSLLRVRNFYGTLQVIDSGTGARAVRALYNGTILHGMQFLSPDRSRLPTTYYGPRSGAGLVLQAGGSANRKVGIIGLGVGTLAAYGRPGDRFRFYEINPAVIGIASSYFRFLKESRAAIEVVPGDGRLALGREPAASFDVLILDAFSGDAIPVHLLTKEAFQEYFRRLRPDGVVAVHLTNKYLDLASVVEGAAGSLQKEWLPVHSAADAQNGLYRSDWVLLADSGESLRGLGWRGEAAVRGSAPRPWTDGYSNLFRILK